MAVRPILLTLAFLPLLMAANEATSLPRGWKDFSPRDKSFSFWGPEAAEPSEFKRVFAVKGNVLKFTLLQVRAKDGPAYSAYTVGLGIRLARQIKTSSRLEIFRDLFVDQVKGKLTTENDVKQGTLTGKEYAVQTGQGLARLRLFSVGSNIHHVAVTGTKEQVEGAEADIFLKSFKLRTRPMPITGRPLPRPDPTTDQGGTGDGTPARTISGDMFAFIKKAVTDKRLKDVDIAGFTLSKETYRDALPDGGILIGFQVGYGKFVNNKTVNSLRPIYLTKDGEKMGNWHGAVPANPATVKAKAGYVVGGISVKAGLTIDGFSLTYVKLGKDRLELDDNYTSDWIGGPGGGLRKIGGKGHFIVGIRGNLNDRNVTCALGLITVLQSKE